MLTLHMQATIEYIEGALVQAEREGRDQDWVTIDGMPVSFSDARAHLKIMRDSGMRLIPCCENCDETGKCQGAK